MSERIEVALAVAMRSGRVLVARRGEGSHLEGLWEFPGGKIEAGETPGATAARELREETALEGGAFEPLTVFVHSYPDRRVTIHAFLVRDPEGEIRTDGDRPWVFGDAYAVAGHHDSKLEDQNGFWIRRAYLTFDYAIAEKWSARLRLEANSPGDFSTNVKLDPFVKDAYLAWKGANTEILMGISPSPTWELVEGFWGYRAIEKTPLDLYRMGTSREFGLPPKASSSAARSTTMPRSATAPARAPRPTKGRSRPSPLASGRPKPSSSSCTRTPRTALARATARPIRVSLGQDHRRRRRPT